MKKTTNIFLLKNGYILYFEWKNDKNITIDNVLSIFYRFYHFRLRTLFQFVFVFYVFFSLFKTIFIKRLYILYNIYILYIYIVYENIIIINNIYNNFFSNNVFTFYIFIKNSILSNISSYNIKHKIYICRKLWNRFKQFFSNHN